MNEYCVCCERKMRTKRFESFDGSYCGTCYYGYCVQITNHPLKEERKETNAKTN